MRTGIVEIFLAIVAMAIFVWAMKIVVKNATRWSQDLREWLAKTVAVSRFRKATRGKSRPGLENVVLALALAEYHWPVRRPAEDESLAKVRERLMLHLKTLSDESVADLIERQVHDRHHLFLKIAMETLSPPDDVKIGKLDSHST